jgi:hypothetical protein
MPILEKKLLGYRSQEFVAEKVRNNLFRLRNNLNLLYSLKYGRVYWLLNFFAPSKQIE